MGIYNKEKFKPVLIDKMAKSELKRVKDAEQLDSLGQTIIFLVGIYDAT